MKPVHKNEYNLRQLKLIKETIREFENKHIDLYCLVTQLSGLLHFFEPIENSWKEKFQREVLSLEVLQSINIVESEEGVCKSCKETEREQEIIKNTIERLKVSIEDILSVQKYTQKWLAQL